MIYFLFLTLFNQVASSFCKKVADLYEQSIVADVFRQPSVLIETPGDISRVFEKTYHGCFLML